MSAPSRHHRFLPHVAWLACAVLVLAGCATTEAPRPERPALTADEGRATIARLLPAGLRDRDGWAADLFAAI
ncbi:MAG TPA: hypothetical protein VFX05_17570, partial [Casimicrobiaceae bacterium]|nr:hypothetical protein [Casimicrobiaceae bacterium]